jgi:UDP-N-acetylglucosamine 4,6-dehydratase (inverting)
MSFLDGKTILVTGGTGTFGQKFIEVLLKEYNPKSIRIYSRGELKQMQMNMRFNDPRLRFLIGDVRDGDRLHRAMNGVDIVVHAAALKQVPACEYNPIEAIRTNVDGAINVINSAIDNSVKKVLALSTDKAVLPVNLYGATKMAAEKLFIQANSYVGAGSTEISCVRYGNVVGSRGSIVPVFMEQRKSGKITITDKRMTRFWITVDQGVRFVINCIERMNGGETFVPKIPSMKIVDFANVIAPGVKIEIIGIRPGEKLHEMLLAEEEARHAREYEGGFVIYPEYHPWKKGDIEIGKPIPEGFTYTSENNSKWLTKEELKTIIDSYDLQTTN